MPLQCFRLSPRCNSTEKTPVNPREGGGGQRILKFDGGSFRLDSILLMKGSVLLPSYETSTLLHQKITEGP